MAGRHTDAEKIAALTEWKETGVTQAVIAAKYGVTQGCFSSWKNKFQSDLNALLAEKQIKRNPIIAKHVELNKNIKYKNFKKEEKRGHVLAAMSSGISITAYARAQGISIERMEEWMGKHGNWAKKQLGKTQATSCVELIEERYEAFKSDVLHITQNTPPATWEELLQVSDWVDAIEGVMEKESN